MWTSCGPTKQGLWVDAQLEQIGNNCTTVWGSNYKVIKTEWDLTLDRDPSSFKVSGMTVCTDQLMWIKEATHVRNIYPWEHEADISGRKKALVQSLKQFHTHFYQLYEKGMTHTTVVLQGLHLGSALKHPSICAGVGLKSFCLWCFKLSRSTEMVAIHLLEVHYQMAIACDICWVFASMTVQNIWDHQPVCKGNSNKEHMEHEACEAHGKAQKSQDSKRNQSLTS